MTPLSAPWWCGNPKAISKPQGATVVQASETIWLSGQDQRPEIYDDFSRQLMANIHYIPEFLLERFKTPQLLELDMATGKIAERSTKKGGSGSDLWSQEIENGMMQKYDDRAAKILKKRIWDKDRIELTNDERLDFAYWLAMFMVRAPLTRDIARKVLQDAEDDPEIAVRALYALRPQALKIIRAQNPEQYDERIEKLGKEAGEEQAMELTADQIRRRELPYMPSLIDTYSKNLLDSSPQFLKAAKLLVSMRWTWYESKMGFCIGDNPLSRWSTAEQQPLRNLAQRRDMEYTFPVSSSLTLCMIFRSRIVRSVQNCNRKMTRRFNHRQRMGSLKHVYACRAELLNPQARFGYHADLHEVYKDRRIRYPDKTY